MPCALRRRSSVNGCFVTEWGRIGSRGTVKQHVFETVELAQTAFTKRIRAKTKRGYLP